jgi:hypothetical protein
MQARMVCSIKKCWKKDRPEQKGIRAAISIIKRTGSGVRTNSIGSVPLLWISKREN